MTLNSNQHPDYPNVSVIILTYNGSEYIKPLLESLLNQSYPKESTEILVVDNASGDETIRIIRENFSSVKVIALEKNIGYAAGNNQALLHASHELLVFLNQDTLCHPGFLHALVDMMEADKTLAACNPNIMTPEVEGFGTMDPGFAAESLYFYDLVPFGYGQNRIVNGKSLFRTRLLSGCAFIIRRETVTGLEYLFDDQLWMYAEDTDLSLRIHNLAHNICVTRDAIVYHLHKSNLNLEKGRILTAAGAIKNRVFAYYKNMSGLEFFFFSPFLFLGGIFKIFAFPLTRSRKAIYFLPFGIFSMACMLVAVFQLNLFVEKKRRIMEQRRIPNFALLKLILKRE
jgi:GT2 family glycosyltransferase